MARLLALLPDPIARARLLAALELDAGAPHPVCFAGSWSEMCCTAGAGPIHLAIFDPYTGGRFQGDECTRFSRAFPSMPLLPYTRFPSSGARDLLHLSSLGVRDMVTRDHDDDRPGLHAAIAQSLAHGVATATLAALEDVIPTRLAPVVHYLLSNAHQPLALEELARAHHRHPKTLREQLQKNRLPPPGKLIVWMRLIHAGHLLEDRSRSLENVVRTLDFPSSSALRNQMHRYVGISPGDLANAPEGGMKVLLRLFRERHRTGHWALNPL